MNTRKWRLEWWHYAVLLLLSGQLVFWIVPQFRPGKIGLICWMVGIDRSFWSAVTTLLFLTALASSLWRPPFWTRWRMTGFGLLLLLAVSPSAFRVYPSSYDAAPSELRFRVPFDQPVTVAWGGDSPSVNYHVRHPSQCWAYDLLVTKLGQSYQGDGSQLSDYYGYGIPVVAPSDGTVHATFDQARDMPPGQLGGRPASGNRIVIKTGDNRFLFLCHLQPGSILVKPGDRVTPGQPLARVGNSGNTSEPHLHIHLQDSPKLHFGEGIPLYFHDYRIDDRIVKRGIPRGGFRDGKPAGDIIAHAGP